MVRVRAALVAAFLTVLSCASPNSDAPLEQRVAAATVDAWISMELPEPPAYCYVERFDIYIPDTEQAYYGLCPTTPRPGVCEVCKSHACFALRLLTPRARTIEIPTAVIRPGETAIESLAVHELAHWLYSCSNLGSAGDPYDGAHTDKRVWGHGETVEGVAMDLLAERALR